MDRVEINGIWYVRENTVNIEGKFDNIDEYISYNLDCLYETEHYVFTASRLYMDGLDSEFYNGITIEFVDKRPENWITDMWDNESWMLGVYRSNPESISEAKEMMCSHGIQQFRNFVHKLISIGWLTLQE